ncbi:pyruvate formate lyase activating enzyme [Arcanobacterium wilhelmae]|uniref:Pyruvate formate-lyase-activating enzyme n=1 Tax=Arcanobacterium wilhelmae TaxID=1803177 RepID=A0ABT9NB06_9ACTO|nr:pyruvate formate-lyase-activating protein [Arcanobacterium wilhelmae]MDP9800391.1 pyruvate formate lyase activating enzyme [Arcanobacterium wilhelmae]WFN89822.1 pyruvate formate-lyase-activating protein [Arcanobacterium wilhelmae]
MTEFDARVYFGSEGSTGEYRPDPLDYEVPRLSGAGTAGIEAAGEMSHEEHLAAVRAGEIGSIHSWELVTAMDGPGTRMTVFMAGCPLRCLYCHNPDTFKMKDGTAIRAQDLLDRIKRYVPVFKASNGGVTFSGGEVLMQPAFLKRVLKPLKEWGVHVALDTSGFLGRNLTDEMMENVDMVLLDIKSGDEETYQRVTGRSLQPTIDFAKRLEAAGVEVWVRFVLIPGLTDDPQNIENVAKLASSIATVSRIEVLPFHQMAKDKWSNLGLEYQLKDVEPPSKEATEAVREVFRKYGKTVY